jgi:hypothetical protein
MACCRHKHGREPTQLVPVQLLLLLQPLDEGAGLHTGGELNVAAPAPAGNRRRVQRGSAVAERDACGTHE